MNNLALNWWFGMDRDQKQKMVDRYWKTLNLPNYDTGYITVEQVERIWIADLEERRAQEQRMDYFSEARVDKGGETSRFTENKI